MRVTLTTPLIASRFVALHQTSRFFPLVFGPFAYITTPYLIVLAGERLSHRTSARFLYHSTQTCALDMLPAEAEEAGEVEDLSNDYGDDSPGGSVDVGAFDTVICETEEDEAEEGHAREGERVHVIG
ncbi:hypothetical protein MMC18_004768 [Xylographa bjoerkii]|nr:hypothetical protein [Xylographa bjoerkii]